MSVEYGFMLDDELLHVGLVGDGDSLTYELVTTAHSNRDLSPWVTTNPILLVHMYLKREDFMPVPSYRGELRLFTPTHPKATFGNAKPVVIITYRDGGTLHKEYRNAIMPRLLPDVGEVVDRATVGKDTRRNIYTYRCPPTELGTMYASPMGNKGSGMYFMTECGTGLVLGYLCHISKDDCLLLSLGKEEVGEALLHGYIPSARGAGIINDQQHLESIPGMVDSIREGMRIPLEECPTDLWGPLDRDS